jgi:trehalose-6-phosphate synthase
MTDAIVTNPYHADGMASDLDRALRAERTERVARNESLRRIVWEDSAAAWTRAWRAALHGLPKLQTGTERG